MIKLMNNLNRTRTFGLMVLMTTTLAACGGGSDSGTARESDSGSSANTATAPIVTVQEPEQPVIQPEQPGIITSTEDLVAADSFLFQSNYKLDVRVDISPEYDYLTICYADRNNQPDYSDCLLRTDLEDGEAVRELLLTNDTDRLLIVAWDYTDVDNPAISFWNRDIDGDLLQVN